MNLFSKLFGSALPAEQAARYQLTSHSDLLDESLDTVASLLRGMGEFDVPLEEEDPRFHDLCLQYARHVTHGEAIIDEGIPASDDGTREWALVRAFFMGRRQQESEFVQQRIRNFRIVVEDLVGGLRKVAEGEITTETNVVQGLQQVEHAAEHGDVRLIRQSIKAAVREIGEVFAEQRHVLESQIAHANLQMQQIQEELSHHHDFLNRDALTNTYNKAGLEIALHHTVNMNFVLRKPVTLALIEITNLSEIQDRFGGSAADDVIRNIADCLIRSFVRRSDIIARIGEGTFGVLLVDITTELADEKVAAALKMIAETVQIPYSGEQSLVTCQAALVDLKPADSGESFLAAAHRKLASL
ncbi:MAG: GGDEF domain-containing protein [Woeseiaceae bacterium]